MKGDSYQLIVKELTDSREQKEACMRLENLVVCIVCLYIQFFFALRMLKYVFKIVKARLHLGGQCLSLESMG